MFEKREDNGVVTFASDILNTPHLFSTRCGGVSTLPHLCSLNVGENRGDDPENIRKNLDILLCTMGMEKSSEVRALQIHSCNVKVVTAADKGEFFGDCDGFVTKDAGVTLCVKVADCVPILLYDEDAKVIAALHAGWKGASGGIAREGVSKMLELGARAENIRAAIGASIHPCCYEVDEPFLHSVINNMGQAGLQYVMPIANKPGKYKGDIVGMNVYYLCRAGVPRENIDICSRCTACSPELFFSHRYTGGVRGTMCAMIALK